MESGITFLLLNFHKVAEETEDGTLYREVLGTYIDYNGVVFGTIDDTATYNALFKALIQPVPYHTIVLPITNEYASFTAYITGVSHSVDRELSDGTHFKALTCNFKANSPTIRAV
jgi:hypothetical protein